MQALTEFPKLRQLNLQATRFASPPRGFDDPVVWNSVVMHQGAEG